MREHSRKRPYGKRTDASAQPSMRSSMRLAWRSGIQDGALRQVLHALACIVDPPSPRLNVPTWTLRMPPAGSGHS
ncbi:hypothetical protein XarjCFBP7653_18255 [Xanthomonas arboricola]|nr:hypothetical protein XarjCFBP7653_18255 [Xanthomonas arboricola]